jgi:hypothetical protein
MDALNNLELYGVDIVAEQDWYAGCRRLSCKSRHQPWCDNHSHSTLDQISRQCWQSVSLVRRPAIFDHQVPAFKIAGFVQTPPETGQPKGVGFRRPVV